MSGFIELVDAGGNSFIVPKSALGVAFFDEEEDCLLVDISGEGYKLQTTYAEYAEKLAVITESV